jgi:hypothetical protein
MDESKMVPAMGASFANTGYARSTVAPARSRIARCKRKFLRFFPEGFRDQTYLDWERGYKLQAHREWQSVLNRAAYQSRLSQGKFLEIGVEAVKIESRTNLLFSFEKMAIRDALKSEGGARAFAEGLYALLHGPGTLRTKFSRWCEVVARLPRKQSRVLTWPLVTVFGFIAQPDTHIFLKPTVTRLAAREYGFDFRYRPAPSWDTYSSLLAFADEIGGDLRDLRPRDLIDIQSFIWVLGSDEYDE